MVRTQVYLTEKQNEGLKRLAATSGRRQSELIRDAVETYLDRNELSDWKEALRAARGIWADRTDLDEMVKQSRQSWEERLDRIHGT